MDLGATDIMTKVKVIFLTSQNAQIWRPDAKK